MAFDLDDDELEATRKLYGVGNKEIQPGEYVRTKLDNIAEVVAVKDTVVWTDDFIDIHCMYNAGIIEKIDIVKHSFNIIDLIEVGDFVNGEYVLAIDYTGNYGEKTIITELNNRYFGSQIISIVTKEQFKVIAYKVKE